jgi:phosphoribosyl 1,2-cyclic phosphodiesterase
MAGHGGNTTCLEVVLGERRRLIVDCGSGLSAVAAGLPKRDDGDALEFDVFMTHYHMDHLQGLPFFEPLFDPRSRFTFYGFGAPGETMQSSIEGFAPPPWFPLSIGGTPSSKRYVELDGASVQVGEVSVSTARLSHPQGITAYRLQRGDRAIVFATDMERGDPSCDAALSSLASGADVLIHDAQYTPEEYEQRRGWGHSSWRHAVAAAREAGVERLILFHHDPSRTDEELDAIVAEAGKTFPRVEAVREGMRLDLRSRPRLPARRKGGSRRAGSSRFPDQGFCEIDSMDEPAPSTEDGSLSFTRLLGPDKEVVSLRVYSKPGRVNRTADEVALSVPFGGRDGSSEHV